MQTGGEQPFRIREVWPPGTVIKGDYEIERRLGGGAFGTAIWLATAFSAQFT